MTITDLTRTIALPDMVMYAGATWDWHRLHYDREYSGAAGLPAPVVDGQQLGALMAKHALGNGDARARLLALDIRFRAMVFAGDTVRVSGIVTGRDGHTVTLAQELHVGTRLCVTGVATVMEEEPPDA